MLKRYFKDTAGNFAIMFSLSATALLFGVAGAIDLNGMLSSKAAIQNLTDSAIIAAATSRSEDINELKQIAQASIDTNNMDGLNLNIDLTVNNGIITISANTKYNTQFAGAIGLDEFPINVISESPLVEEIPVNIALVLDTTGSMDGANMNALKSASKVLLRAFDSIEPGAVNAGVVPYSKYVNVGLTNRGRPWMDVPADSAASGTEICHTRPQLDTSQCTILTVPDTCYNDSGAYSCTRNERTCPPSAYGPDEMVCQPENNSQTWNGCAGSRVDPLQKEPAYDGNPIPGVMNVSCGSEVLDLTTNLLDVENKIDSLVANGNTYIPAGLIWGWRLLDGNEPFGGLTNMDPDRKKAMVLMTDGANTVRYGSPNHNNDLQQVYTSETNDLTTSLCDAIKGDGIDLFTVAYNFGSGNTAAETMIENCASTPNFFFKANNAEELETAFSEIASSLYEVRLSR